MTIPQHWTERVRAGDFSAIPVPFTWAQSAEFSHLIDAYELTGSLKACWTIMDRVLEEIRFSGHSTASALDIWVSLFLQWRGCKHTGSQPNRARRALLDVLCERLRVQLLSLGPEQHAGILAAMEEPRKRVRA